MPLEQTEAIVLKTQPLADQDKLVTFFSLDRGLIRGVAKGARKFGNRFGSSLEPLSVVRVFYYEKERRDLVTVSNCDLLESFFDIQADPATAFTLAYFSELVEEFFPARSGEDKVYRLLRSVLRALKAGADRSLAARYFEAWFLQINGLLPDFKRCRKCRRPVEAGWLAPKRDGVDCPDCAVYRREETRGELLRFLDWIRGHPPGPESGNPFAPEELEAIGRILQDIIIYHLEREPKALVLTRGRKA
jgi:DNA repair protein RecO (recombination protein O)